MTDDLPFDYGETPATVNVTTKRCGRHDWYRAYTEDVYEADQGGYVDLPDGRAIAVGLGRSLSVPRELPGTFVCARCGKVRDETARIRNRRNASRGKAIQRKRIEGLGGQNLPGNKQNHDGIGLAFGYESKSGGAFSKRYWRWLKGIPVHADQTAVLIVTETPGPGRRARSYVVVEYDEWRALHGEQKGEGE